MSDIAIRVEGLGKEYVIGAREKRNETFREMLTSSFSAPFRRLFGKNGNGGSSERFWALKEVSFEVKRGEVLGVIGRNGAGKSTLLKILSRITEPTEGRVEIRGRVASLLEVGTGFHPELTGRENLYLNGAILGMSRKEIESKFDEIVDFAGIEKFLDTPVKRYSSGMYVRLAFAVAAHLEPEILVVDEVLAVGDMEFQKKCLGKMKDVAGSGRTVLFVSHNMVALERLCPRAILLREGAVAGLGATRKVIEQYSRNMLGGSDWGPGPIALRRSHPSAILKSITFFDSDWNPIDCIRAGASAIFAIDGFAGEPLPRAVVSIAVKNSHGQTVTSFHSRIQSAIPLTLRGHFRLTCRVGNLRLFPGQYHLNISLYSNRNNIEESDPLVLNIIPSDIYNTGHALEPWFGMYLSEAVWEEQDPSNTMPGAVNVGLSGFEDR